MPVALAVVSLLWPVPGEIVRPFALGRDPYARGQHRGIDIAAGAGTEVVSPCGGRVAFAGPIPAAGIAVSIDCRGDLRASLLGLRSAGVARGERLRAGAPVGALGSGPLHLGVRRFSRYLDPEGLLAPPPAPGLGAVPAPGPRAPRRTPGPAAPRAGRSPSSMPAWVPALGFGLAVAAIAGGVPLRRRRPARARAVASVALRRDVLLHHDADLLRQRAAPSRPRVHDDRGGRDGPPHAPARGGRVLPDRHR